MNKTKIEWTDSTWNPVRGCSRISEGCRNCYAESVAARFSGPGLPYEGLAEMTPSGPRWTGKVRLVEEHLDDPIRWKKPRRIFVNSMSDLFHEALSFESIRRVFDVMTRARQHVFQVLTKRPGRAIEFFRWLAINPGEMTGPMAWPQGHVWIGVSVEDQKSADERIPLLVQIPAWVRFLSIEPLIGRVVLPMAEVGDWPDPIVGLANPKEWDDWKYWSQRDAGIGWVIVGGESGHEARPMTPDWVRSLRDQCVASRVPFFFKQWGEWRELHDFALQNGEVPASTPRRPVGPSANGGPALMARVGKKAAGRELDGRTWDEFPAVRS